MRIMLDPGHGGRDFGCCYMDHTIAPPYRIVREAGLTLNLALLLYDTMIHNHKPWLTRATDRMVSLQSRVYLANILNVDLFVSLHFNADEKHVGSGCETYHHPTNIKTKQFAEDLSEYFSSVMEIRNRGAKPSSDLYVINNTKMPAILVECCFIHEKTLKEEDTLNRMAYALGNGIPKCWEVRQNKC